MDKVIKNGFYSPIDKSILIGKWVKITSGPKKGQMAIVKDVLKNGDIIIE
jgi:transcription elongation factor